MEFRPRELSMSSSSYIICRASSTSSAPTASPSSLPQKSTPLRESRRVRQNLRAPSAGSGIKSSVQTSNYYSIQHSRNCPRYLGRIGKAGSPCPCDPLQLHRYADSLLGCALVRHPRTRLDSDLHARYVSKILRILQSSSCLCAATGSRADR